MTSTSTRRKTLTDKMIKAKKPDPDKRLTIPDPDCRGLYIRITRKGIVSFCVVARGPDGAQVWATLKTVTKIDEAREEAPEVRKRIQKGLAPFEPPQEKPDSFKAVAENYLKRHVEAKGLRSKTEIERILDRYIYPALKDREFVSIRRSDVTLLLDKVQDANGPRQADYTLAVIRGIMNWYAPRTDDYVPPIVPKMRRTDPKARKRKRILDDDEIRVVWKVAEDKSTFGAIIRLALLTGQRRAKIAALKWADIDQDGIWNIQTDDREKGNAGVLKLPEQALAVIHGQKRINDFVFAGRGDGHFAGFSPCKRAFNQKVTMALREAAVERGDDPETVEPLPRWTLHDLRRTARSLMSDANVRPDVAERVLGHEITGIEGVYNLSKYQKQKDAALKRLAVHVETILNPTPEDEKVVKIR